MKKNVVKVVSLFLLIIIFLQSICFADAILPDGSWPDNYRNRDRRPHSKTPTENISLFEKLERIPKFQLLLFVIIVLLLFIFLIMLIYIIISRKVTTNNVTETKIEDNTTEENK